MSDEPVVTKGEMDALLEAQESDAPRSVKGGAEPVEVALHQLHAKHGSKAKFSGLDPVNQRFAEKLPKAFQDAVRLNVETTLLEVVTLEYAEYENSLARNASVNPLNLDALHSTALLVIDPNLAFLVVETFFGGRPKSVEVSVEQELTPIAQRIVSRLVNACLRELAVAWAPTMALEAVAAAPDALDGGIDSGTRMVVCKFQIELDDINGELHIAYPQDALVLLRSRLVSGVSRDSDDDRAAWSAELKERLREADVEVSAVFGEVELRLRDLLQLKAGDFVPVNMRNPVQFCVDGVPLFDGIMGSSNGFASAKLLSRHARSNTTN